MGEEVIEDSAAIERGNGEEVKAHEEEVNPDIVH